MFTHIRTWFHEKRTLHNPTETLFLLINNSNLLLQLDRLLLCLGEKDSRRVATNVPDTVCISCEEEEKVYALAFLSNEE